MANYGLLAGEDYWEDFTPDAPTETGVVGKVTGQRYQPWEKGYHKIAGLVDDSGDYDAWYDPDPPPETSVPEWATPEGYENWKKRIALDTTTTNGDGTNLPEGGAGEPDASGSFGGTPWQDTSFSSLGEKLGWDKAVGQGTDWATSSPLSPDYKSSGPFGSLSDVLGTVDISKAILGGFMAGPLGAIFGAVGGGSGIKSLLDGTHPALQGAEPQSQAEADANIEAMGGGAEISGVHAPEEKEMM